MRRIYLLLLIFAAHFSYAIEPVGQLCTWHSSGNSSYGGTTTGGIYGACLTFYPSNSPSLQPNCLSPSGYYHPIFTSCSPNTGTCPSGYTVGLNTCTVTPNPCVALSGQTVSSGYYDLGTDPNKMMKAVTCNNGCFASYNGLGVASKSALINGVRHYYAQGTIVYLNVSQGDQGCTGTDIGTTPNAQPVPADNCAPGQSSISMYGRTVCLDPTTKEPVNTPPFPTSVNSATSTSPSDPTTKTTTEGVTYRAGDVTNTLSSTTITTTTGLGENQETKIEGSISPIETPDNAVWGSAFTGAAGRYNELKSQLKEGWGFESILPNTGACTPPTASLHGHQVTFNYCNGVSIIRKILGWLFYIFTAWAIFRIFTSSFGGV